jgi:hypothetical protein
VEVLAVRRPRAITAAVGLLAALAPAAAAACPACALRASPGATVLALIGGMVAVPYLVAVIAIRIVRSLDQP